MNKVYSAEAKRPLTPAQRQALKEARLWIGELAPHICAAETPEQLEEAEKSTPEQVVAWARELLARLRHDNHTAVGRDPQSVSVATQPPTSPGSQQTSVECVGQGIKRGDQLIHAKPNVTAPEVTAKPTRTELEMAAGRKAAKRYAAPPAASPKKVDGPPTVIPFSGETTDTGIIEAFDAQRAALAMLKRAAPTSNVIGGPVGGVDPNGQQPNASQTAGTGKTAHPAIVAGLHNVVAGSTAQSTGQDEVSLRDAALAYARAGIPVFPAHTIRNGVCGCGGINGCSPGKHPIARLVPHGVLDASSDPDVVARWWEEEPNANIGIATGKASNLVVVDVDGPAGEATLAEIERKHGSLPPTRQAKTGKGRHLYFRRPENVAKVKSVARTKLGLDVRGDGGYVIAPPSSHVSGRQYVFDEDRAELAECPDCIVAYANGGLKILPTAAVNDQIVNLDPFNQKPSQAFAAVDPKGGSLAEGIRAQTTPPPHSEVEEARVRSALASISPDERDTWRDMGAALHWLNWAEKGFVIWNDWSRRCSEKYNEDDQQKTWESFGRSYEGDLITVATLFYKADQLGWIDETLQPETGHSANEIRYFPGNEAACRDALDAIVAADQFTFSSGEVLVILRVPEQNRAGLERWYGDLPGTTQALPADIVERAENLAWMTRTGGRGGRRWNRSKPPRDFCTDYLTQLRGRYGARPLVGIARVPYMRDDGSIRGEIGYDPETGIFVDRAPKLIIPSSPTMDDAIAAYQRLMKPFEYYTFEDRENGLPKVFAAILTALERSYIKTAPLFAVNAPQSGSGKGQLCRAIGHLALGTTPPFMAWGHDDDEFKKRFDTMLLASPAALVLDNCNNRIVRGDTLEMIISEGQATIRLFNKLEAVTVRNRTFIMANGNNIQVSGDMSRRTVKNGILPGSANPELAKFPFTPEDYVTEHRDALLSDCYTVMRAYRSAGMPRSGLPAVGSFSEWEHKVRDLVWWLTGYDLSEEFARNKKDDPEQQEDAALLAAIRGCFGENWFKASEVDAALKRAMEGRRQGGLVNVAEHPGALLATAMERTGAQTIVELIQAVGPGGPFDDPKVFDEIKARVDQPANEKENALLEAGEQKWGAGQKHDYAKTVGNWARGIENKYIDGLILRRREDPHTKIYRFKVSVAE